MTCSSYNSIIVLLWNKTTDELILYFIQVRRFLSIKNKYLLTYDQNENIYMYTRKMKVYIYIYIYVSNAI